MTMARFRKLTMGLSVLLAVVLCAGQAVGGLSGNTVWEARTTGSDTACSGGFRGGAFIAPPSAPTVNGSGSGGTVAANTYYVVATYTDGLGETVISGQTSVTTTGSTSSITVTSPGASTGALTWSCYVGTVSGGPYFPQGTGLVIGTNRTITSTPPTSGTQPRGVDYSVQDAAQISVADAVANGTTTVTSATAGFSGAVVGNVARINNASYDIVAVTNATTIVVDRGVTTGSSLALIIGGGFATPGQAGAYMANNHTLYIKSGTYTFGGGSANTSGNALGLGIASIYGYSTNRRPGNSDTKPTLDAGAASITLIGIGGGSANIETVSFTNSGSRASVTGINDAATQAIRRNLSFDHIATPYTSGQLNHWSDVYCNACGSAFVGNGNHHLRWVANAPVAAVFGVSGAGYYVRECIAIGGAPTDAHFGVSTGYYDSCISYGATGTNGNGFFFNTDRGTAVNCISYGNAQKGFRTLTSQGMCSMVSCASGGNGTDYDTQFLSYQKVNCLTLSANPFTNASGNDYSLNSSAGGGALCRGAGIPGTWPGLSTTGYRDIGAAQHGDPAGAAGGKKAGPGGGKVGMLGPAIRLRQAG